MVNVVAVTIYLVSLTSKFSFQSLLLPSAFKQRPQYEKKSAELIRTLRSRRNITQAALASLTGIHRTYLSRAERGQVIPSLIALMQIGRALETDKILLRVQSSSN